MSGGGQNLLGDTTTDINKYQKHNPRAKLLSSVLAGPELPILANIIGVATRKVYVYVGQMCHHGEDIPQ